MLKSGGSSFQASNKSAFPVRFQNVVNDSIFKHKYIRLGNKPKVKTDGKWKFLIFLHSVVVSYKLYHKHSLDRFDRESIFFFCFVFRFQMVPYLAKKYQSHSTHAGHVTYGLKLVLFKLKKEWQPRVTPGFVIWNLCALCASLITSYLLALRSTNHHLCSRFLCKPFAKMNGYWRFNWATFNPLYVLCLLEYCRTMDLSKKKHSFLPDRPANSGSLERRCQGKYLLRPALQIKRFSSPPGTLQGFDQYMKEQTNER